MTYTLQLHQIHQEEFTKSITHPLTNELCAGTLSDTALYVYLKQDLKFFLEGLRVFGKAIALCDNEVAILTLGKQIGFICNDENDYFRKAISEIESHNLQQLKKECPSMLGEAPALPEVQKYINLLEDISNNCKSYAAVITFLYIMEKVYLGWAEHNYETEIIKDSLPYKYMEWIKLHSGNDFSAWVKFLEDEVNRVTTTDENQRLSEAVFVKAIDLEIAFFDACHRYRE
ncbi:hypothetical protein QFC19_004677 [Naganishia cerealis]|uniref:Uncharacterized protein n=1 Tax=Naganishia cerealis TaxID=610337 RepID=A0ACC2VTJ0_9TREE|nr:hypothetical protein QFC19_004677 [Naganishia cerealis]